MWYRIPVTIYLDVEAEDDASALSKAETIIEKRVVGQSFGYEKNDQGSVSGDYTIERDGVEKDEDT